MFRTYNRIHSPHHSKLNIPHKHKQTSSIAKVIYCSKSVKPAVLVISHQQFFAENPL